MTKNYIFAFAIILLVSCARSENEEQATDIETKHLTDNKNTSKNDAISKLTKILFYGDQPTSKILCASGEGIPINGDSNFNSYVPNVAFKNDSYLLASCKGNCDNLANVINRALNTYQNAFNTTSFSDSYGDSMEYNQATGDELILTYVDENKSANFTDYPVFKEDSFMNIIDVERLLNNIIVQFRNIQPSKGRLIVATNIYSESYLCNTEGVARKVLTVKIKYLLKH